jgi:hypothetical protein
MQLYFHDVDLEILDVMPRDFSRSIPERTFAERRIVQPAFYNLISIKVVVAVAVFQTVL